VKPYYEDEIITIYHGDCREVIKDIHVGVDAVITDPPYPDYHVELYNYHPETLQYFTSLKCKQFIFWSVREQFPLDYTAIHIWNKEVPSSPYERIFERNGGDAYKLFSHQFVNNRVLARFHKDEWTKHPSQKPIALMIELILLATDLGQTVLDPFAGSGSTLKAAKMCGRKAIGIEIEERWCEYMVGRLSQDMLFPLDEEGY